MDKISYIDSYIEECKFILLDNDQSKANTLITDIVSIFHSEIDDITRGLISYEQYGVTDYLGDIRLLKQKLLNYQINLQEEKKKQDYNLEMARLQQTQITANAESNPTITQNTTVNVEISLEQTIEKIDEIDNENLSSQEKEQIKEYLYSLEGVKASKNKSLLWNKTKDVLKFIADKGIDVAIAALPYLIKTLTT